VQSLTHATPPLARQLEPASSLFVRLIAQDQVHKQVSLTLNLHANGLAKSVNIMDAIVDPSADAIWGAVGTVVDETGVHESSPKSDEDWANMHRAAIRIIEGGNLLTVPGRDVAPPGTKSETPGVELEPAEIAAIIRNKRNSFDAFARALRGMGFEVLTAAEKKDAASLIEIGGRLQDVCENCHQTFWYPNAAQPGANRPIGRK